MEAKNAELKQQLSKAEQHRVGSAEALEGIKSKLRSTEEQLQARDAELALMRGGDVDKAVDELRQAVESKDSELSRVKEELQRLRTAGGSGESVTELKAQLAEYQAILESGGSLGGGGDSEKDQVINRLREEITGLKAAYDAAERSLEEQDGAIDSLTQNLIKAQQRIGDLEAARASAAALGATAPGFPAPPAPPALDVAHLKAGLMETKPATPSVVIVDDEPEDEPTKAMPAFELPDTAEEDDVEDEPTRAMPAFSLPDDDAEDEPTKAMPAFSLPDDDHTATVEAADLLAAAAHMREVASELFVIPPRSGDAQDDLKKIKGIGPAIEKRLNKAGLFTYVQLAGIADKHIDELGDRVKVSGEQIRRNRWLAQAKSLSGA